MSCKDFPCCEHDVCEEMGKEEDWKRQRCVCGITLPLDDSVSLCDVCFERAFGKIERSIPEPAPHWYLPEGEEFLEWDSWKEV